MERRSLDEDVKAFLTRQEHEKIPFRGGTAELVERDAVMLVLIIPPNRRAGWRYARRQVMTLRQQRSNLAGSAIGERLLRSGLDQGRGEVAAIEMNRLRSSGR